ncbi:MAG: caspase family protein [Prevotella sp.]|nr:caspase family protein [Prevotella sp.]
MNKRLCAILLMTAMTVMAVAQTAQELLNDANAKYEAGQMDAALELYTQAANKGLAEAQYQLGKMYYLGESGSKDYSSASMWFKRAARQRHAKAEYGLATCYMNGDGLPVNYDQALMYMKASALRGYVPAQRKLAELYQKGVLVEADSVEAKRWRDMSDGKDVTLVPEFERPTKIIAQAPTASSTSTAPATTAPVADPVNSVATTPAVSAVATAIADPPVGYSATILPPSERPDSLVKLMDLVKLSRTERLDSLNQALMDSLTTTGVLNKRMIATIDSMMIADSLEVVRLERLRQLKLQVAQQAQRKKSLVVLPKDSEIQRDLPPSASTHWDVPLEALTLKQDDKVPAPVSAPVATPTDDASDVASAVTPAASPVNNTQDQIEEEMSQTNGAPVVRILYPEDQSLFHTDVVKLKYQLLAQGLESSTKVTVMVDGVRQPDSRAVKQADMIEVDVPNRDCTIMLFAQNEKGNSIPATIRLIRENVSEADLPRLFAVVVGVGDYKDEKLLPLKMTVKDANDFANVLRSKKGHPFTEVEVKLLCDQEATRGDIFEAMEWMGQEARPNDLCMFFFAGHGYRDERDRFFFMPYGGNTKRTYECFSATDFKDAAEKINSKFVVFADACYSAGLLEGNRSAAAEHFVEQLRRSKNGMLFYASSAGDTKSKEDPTWGNGAFTKALVEAFNGAARKDGDEGLSTRSLDAYLYEAVRKTTDYKQTPVFMNPSGIEHFNIFTYEK